MRGSKRRPTCVNTGRCKAWGASRLWTDAKSEMKFMLSSLHLPPVSMATTTRWQRAPSTNSAHLASWSRRARTSTAPSTFAALVQAAPQEVVALRNVTSTASRAPCRTRRPEATNHLDLSIIVGRTNIVHIMMLVLTTAPASRQILATSLRSGGSCAQSTCLRTSLSVAPQTVQTTTRACGISHTQWEP